MTPLVGAAEVAAAAQLASLLEVTAPKPGNVAPGRPFGDTRYEDFLASAAAVGAPLGTAGTRRLGLTIREAVETTARWTRSNTNLGIILLLAPLARAALIGDRHAASDPIAWRTGLRDDLRSVLAGTTVDDARDVYAAIRTASPGGLGRVDDQDVTTEPTVTLLQAMRLAAHRDGIAREYDTAYEATFTVGAPALEAARGAGLSWTDAIVETFLTLLAAAPDTHIARRAGAAAAEAASSHARLALAAGGVRSAAGREALARMDVALRDDRNLGNPGTTADITAASIFVVLLGGGWHSTGGGFDAAAR